MGPKDLQSSLPRAIRENAGMIQFINGRIVATAICVAMVLFAEFYWPVAVVTGMVAAELWVLSKRAHKRDANPYRPISAFWKQEQPAPEIGLRVVAALASDEWRRIKRRWYMVSIGIAVAVWIGSPILKQGLHEMEPRQAMGPFSALVVFVSFYAWITLIHYWYATLQARFLRSTLLAEEDFPDKVRPSKPLAL